MTNVVKLSALRQARADHKTLCRAGFHKWQVVESTLNQGVRVVEILKEERGQARMALT